MTMAPGSPGKNTVPSPKRADRERTSRQLAWWEDVQDIIMFQIDVLVLLLIAAVILFPIMWFTVGDVAFLAGYVALLSLICFVILYVVLMLVDRRLSSLGKHIHYRKLRD